MNFKTEQEGEIVELKRRKRADGNIFQLETIEQIETKLECWILKSIQTHILKLLNHP